MGEAVINFEPQLDQGPSNKTTHLVRTARILAVKSQTPGRLEHAKYLSERSRLVFHPMEDAVQVNDVETRVRKFGQILGAADVRFEISRCLGSGDLDPQRQRVDAYDMPRGADALRDMDLETSASTAHVQSLLP